jgi:hypothetical protein
VARHNCDKTQHETKHAQSCVRKIAIKICWSHNLKTLQVEFKGQITILTMCMFGIADKVTANHRDFAKPTHVKTKVVGSKSTVFNVISANPPRYQRSTMLKLKIENPNPDHFSCKSYFHSIYTKSNIPNKEIHNREFPCHLNNNFLIVISS